MKHIKQMLLTGILGLSLTLAAQGLAAKSFQPESKFDKTAPSAQVLKDKWGVELVAMRLSAANHMLDFRYKVLDGKKSAKLFDRKITPLLLHNKSGRSLTVQTSDKVGSLRSTGVPKEGRVYWMFFRNYHQMVRRGDQVAVKIGDFLVENVTVE